MSMSCWCIHVHTIFDKTFIKGIFYIQYILYPMYVHTMYVHSIILYILYSVWKKIIITMKKSNLPAMKICTMLHFPQYCCWNFLINRFVIRIERKRTIFSTSLVLFTFHEQTWFQFGALKVFLYFLTSLKNHYVIHPLM